MNTKFLEIETASDRSVNKLKPALNKNEQVNFAKSRIELPPF